MTIFYLAPPFRTGKQPRAGVKRLYHHVSLLNELGFSAFIVYKEKPYWWKRGRNPYQYVRYLADVLKSIKRTDILVITEAFADIACSLRYIPARKFILALNPHHIYPVLRKAGIRSYRQAGIERVMACSGIIRDYIEYSMDMPVDLIPFSFDRKLYYYSEQEQRDFDLTYIHNKRKGSTVFDALEVLKARNKSYITVPLKNLAETEYASTLRKSNVYLSVTIPKGIPTDCMEAMACGCIVVGYPGIGGHEYMHHANNCFVVEDNNYYELARTCEQVIDRIRSNDPGINDIRNAALQTLAPFTPEQEREGLSRYFTQVISDT